MPDTLSARGRRLVDAPLRADLDLFRDAEEDAFDPVGNPDGAIALCIAENALAWPHVRGRLVDLARDAPPDWVAAYADVCGAPPLREALAGFAGRHLATAGEHAPLALDAEGFCVASGATAVVELTAMLLGDPGDVAAFPAPCYPVYAKDVGHKAGLERYDVACEAGWAHAGGTHPLRIADLDRARAEVEASGRRLRVLVLTQPDNPTGAVYEARQLEAAADWCEAHRVHLCVNELYALSRLDADDPRLAGDYADPLPRYRSFLHAVEARRSPYLHWWYSFSKDFGASGLRAGALYTRNEELVAAFGNLGAPHTVSNHTQWLLAGLLGDDAWVGAFAKTNRAALTEAYATVVKALRGAGVPYVPARGSLFAWMNLAGHPLYDGDDEAFWRRAYEDHRVLLTHPGGFGQAERGWFRLVYACVGGATLEAALGRLFPSGGGG